MMHLFFKLVSNKYKPDKLGAQQNDKLLLKIGDKHFSPQKSNSKKSALFTLQYIL